MPEIKAMFFDIGGVLLTNGWDRTSRRHCIESFGLDWEEYEDRHELMSDPFETGEITIDRYLERTVFYRDRPFSRDEFIAAMRKESLAHPEMLDFLAALAGTRRYLLSTLNNESRELNRYRVETFGLHHYFSLFLTSGYLGVKKPDEHIYRLALDITQRQPDECVLIDDRAVNLEGAHQVGMIGIHFESLDQLRSELAALGVTV